MKFGTASWDIDVARRNGFDRAQGIRLETIDFAANEAARLALETGAVDVILTDWLWAMRRRADGTPFRFVPASKPIGSLLVPAGSPATTADDLRGMRIGVAGGPLDKNWIILRAYLMQRSGVDPVATSEPIYGAPPLLQAEFERGRLDALLTYWHHAVRAERAGARAVLTVSDALRAMQIPEEVPLLGWAYRLDRMAGRERAIQGLMAALADARDRMANSAVEWRALVPLIGTNDSQVLERLQSVHRQAGLSRPRDLEGAADLLHVMNRVGGNALTGGIDRIDPGLFPSDMEP